MDRTSFTTATIAVTSYTLSIGRKSDQYFLTPLTNRSLSTHFVSDNNGNNVDQDDINWYATVLIAFVIFGIFGNTLICIAVPSDKRLQNPTNYFLMSLAVADLLGCVLVMPFSIITAMNHGRWHTAFGFALCAFHSYTDVFLCSASIVHITSISLDRYVRISRPLVNHRFKSRFVVTLKIAVVWLLTFVISCPLMLVFALKPGDVYDGQRCQIANKYYMIYGSTLAFIIPFAINLITYLSFLVAVQKNQKDELGSEIMNTTFLKARWENNSMNLLTRVRDKDLLDIPYLTPTIMTANNSSIQLNDERHSSSTGLKLSQNTCRLKTFCLNILRRNRNSRHRTSGTNYRLVPTADSCKVTPMIVGARELASEQKATRVLGLVFACFFVCWTPFFVLNLTYAFCPAACAVPFGVEMAFLWLGFISSTLNPIIYTIFNKKFRQSFVRVVFCCRWTIRVSRASGATGSTTASTMQPKNLNIMRIRDISTDS